MKRYIYSTQQDDYSTLQERTEEIAKQVLPSNLIYEIEEINPTMVEITISHKDNNCGKYSDNEFVHEENNDAIIKNTLQSLYRNFKRHTGWSPKGKDPALSNIPKDVKVAIMGLSRFTGRNSYTDVSDLDQLIDPEDLYEFQDDIDRKYKRENPKYYNNCIKYNSALRNYLESYPMTYRELKRLHNKLKPLVDSSYVDYV